MEGTLVLKEERKNVNKFKKFYQEKIVDTKISEYAEKAILGGTKLASGIAKVIGAVGGTIITIFAPEAAIFAPLVPVVKKFESKVAEFSGNTLIKGKRYVEGKLIGVDGSSKDVIIPEHNLDELVKEGVDVASKAISLVKDEQVKESGGKTL